jgi:hypothetical protein
LVIGIAKVALDIEPVRLESSASHVALFFREQRGILPPEHPGFGSPAESVPLV